MNNKSNINYNKLFKNTIEKSTIEKSTIEKSTIEQNKIEKNKDVSVIKYIYKAKWKKQADKINNDYYNWYCYYKLHLNYLFNYLLKLCKYNKINIENSKEVFLNFVYTMYMNSSKNKIPKHLLDII